MLSFCPLDVLDEIWDLIESVSEGFLTYSFIFSSPHNWRYLLLKSNFAFKLLYDSKGIFLFIKFFKIAPY